MARLVVVLALLVACCVPAAAHAQSFSISAQGSDASGLPAGPAVAGDSILWWDQRGNRSVLVLAPATSRPRDLVSVRDLGSPEQSVAAFGTRAIAKIQDAFYDVDVPSGTVRSMDPCFGTAACASCRAASHSNGFAFELVGTVLSTGQKRPSCQSGAVHDFADGAHRVLPGPVLAAAGTYAVVREATEMSLYNWRTGQRLRTLGPGPLSEQFERGVAVDEHGTVVFAALTGRTTHDPFGVDSDQVRLAGGLLAQRRVILDDEFDPDFGARSHSVFWVSRPDGSQTRRIRGRRFGGGWDFDGRRLAWATQPCVEVRIQVWDLAGDPPAPASERCGVPRIRQPHLRFNDRSIWFRAACPRRPARGCDADLHAVIRHRGGGPRVGETVTNPVHMGAGSGRRNGLEVFDPVRLRKVRGPLRVTFVFQSHGRRATVTRTVRG